VYYSERWQKYKYAVAALIVIMVFCGFLFSYVGVAIQSSNPTAKPHPTPMPVYLTNSSYGALNNIAITNYIPPLPLNSTIPVLISFSTGKWSIGNGVGYLNITNTSSQSLTLALKMSANITAINQQQTNYNLGTVNLPNVTLSSCSSQIISATLNDTTPIVNWTERPSGYFGYSWSIQASLANNPVVGYKTFSFNGSIYLY